MEETRVVRVDFPMRDDSADVGYYVMSYADSEEAADAMREAVIEAMADMWDLFMEGPNLYVDVSGNLYMVVWEDEDVATIMPSFGVRV